MKMFQISLGFCAVFYSCAYACQIPEIEFRKATPEDAESIVDLINRYGVQDNDKIVILPSLFRLMAVQKNIHAGRYYVAYDQMRKLVVGFKKFFVMDNPDERQEIAQQELRYTGRQAELVDQSMFVYLCDQVTKKPADATVSKLFRDDEVVYIYNGGDFTHPSPEYRGKGINTMLTRTALNDLRRTFDAQGCATHAKAIACVYGLTHLNDYADNGSGKSRTPGLARLFGQFISGVVEAREAIIIYHKRFRSCMPTFAQESLECVPLPDDQAIKGYGNVLYYILSRTTCDND